MTDHVLEIEPGRCYGRCAGCRWTMTGTDAELQRGHARHLLEDVEGALF